VSLALHGAAVWLVIALGGKHLPAPRKPALIPIEIVAAPPGSPSPAPLAPARTPPAARPANPGAGAGRRAPPPRAQPTAPTSVRSLTSLQVHYEDRRSFADHGPTAQADANYGTVASGIGAGAGNRPGDGGVNLGIPEPPAGVSLARPPRIKDRHLYSQRITGASRFAGQYIWLQLAIDEHGRVGNVQVLQGVDPELDRKMVARVRGFEYWPALDEAGEACAVNLRSKFQIVEDDEL
jgi:hypothetical protein